MKSPSGVGKQASRGGNKIMRQDWVANSDNQEP